MAALTEHYSLQELSAGDNFSTNGQKYTLADRVTIDRLLYRGAEGHHHTGLAAANLNPTIAGTLTVASSGGSLTAGSQVNYAYTFVDPDGFETAQSPTVFVALPNQISAPNPPTVVATAGTGTLPAGPYFYVLTAYTTSSSSETTPSAPQYVNLTATGENVLTLPTLPSGASGFNIYRKDPNGANYLFLASVASGTAGYTDNGSVATNCNRLSPTVNTTNSTYSVTFTLPVTPPSGYSWNLYRTTTAGVWTSSFLTNNANSATTYVDTGSGTTSASPPIASELIGTPAKVNLSSEVQGVLPSSMVANFPLTITFTFPGALTVGKATSVWVNPYPSAVVNGVQLALEVGSTPASQPVIADLLLGPAASGNPPTYASVFAGGTPPEIPVGKQIGAYAQTPESGATPQPPTLAAGDALVAAITQTGGGATPTDQFLTMTVSLSVVS